MGDIDAGTVKATVRITLEDEGTQQAEERLNSLKAAAGDAGGAVAGAGENFAQLGEKAIAGAEGTKTFSDVIAELPKITEGGTSTIAGLTEALGENQQAVRETGSAFEALQEPVGTSVEMLQNVAPPMSQITDHAEALQKQLAPVNESFAQMGESLGQTIPQLPQFSQTVSDNMGVLGQFNRAVDDPDPWRIINDHLVKTGQTWDDFTGTIGEDNAQLLNEMVANANDVRPALDTIGSGFSGTATSAQEADKAVRDFLGTGETVSKSGGASWLSGQSETLFGEGGFMSMLGDVAMPLMALQMIGMAVGAIGQSIYDSAAIAEGPGAHGYGTFTGAVDTLNASVQASKQNFSEGFGQGSLPALKGLNDANGTSGGIDWGWFGQGVGMETGLAGDLLSVGFGLITDWPPNPISNKLIQSGNEGLQNYFADWTGQPEPFPGPMPPDQTQVAIQQTMAQMPQQLAVQTAQMQAMASDPQFLAAQAYLSSQQGKAQREQASYDVSHYNYDNATPLDTMFDPTTGQQVSTQTYIQEQLNRLGPQAFGSRPSPYSGFSTGGGCFVAGTLVLMADGTEKPIEALQEGEQVQAYYGKKASILALIRPPKKPVYELTFADGNTLTLTDSHPIAALEGWKSLSPEATKQENPELAVTTLQIGDSVATRNGVTTLVTIQPRGITQVYNITVDDPHIFYANNILVHNKMADQIGPQIADQVQNVQLPTMNLSGIASQVSGAFSNLGTVGSSFHVDFTGITSGISSQLSAAFSSIGNISASLPSIDLSGVANIGSTISSSLSSLSSIGASIHLPDIGGMLNEALGRISNISVPDIGGMLNGAMQGMFATIGIPKPPDIGAMLSGAMDGIFTNIGIPKPPDVGAMITGAISGIFGNITLPPVPNIGGAISGALSAMLGSAGTAIPGFASGIQGFSGGPAVVGEGSSIEAVSYNGQYALFNSATLVNLPPGASVYPMQDLSASSFANPQGTGVGGGGISLGGALGLGDITVNVTHLITLDGQALAQGTVPHIAPLMRYASGYRGY